MAQRYGGKFSPAGKTAPNASPPRARRASVSPVGARANVLFLAPVILLATTVTSGAVTMVTGLIGAGLLSLGAFLLRGGLEAEAAYDERKLARRPALPRKIFAAVLTGVGIGVAAFAHDSGLLASALYAVATGALFLAAFGIDPLTDKGMEGIDTFQQDRVARVTEEAETYLDAMKDAVRRAGDRQMEAEVDNFQSVARDLIRTVEEDPRDLTGARKYLGVYLIGARDATVKFADIYSRLQDQKARDDYAALLADLTQNFAARTQKLMVEDRSDLTIEIDVLRDRLAREGVRLEDPTDP